MLRKLTNKTLVMISDHAEKLPEIVVLVFLLVTAERLFSDENLVDKGYVGV